jgi:hypothetical protein
VISGRPSCGRSEPRARTIWVAVSRNSPSTDVQFSRGRPQSKPTHDAPTLAQRADSGCFGRHDLSRSHSAPMMLTSLDLHDLRRGLRSHPRIAPEVADRTRTNARAEVAGDHTAVRSRRECPDRHRGPPDWEYFDLRKQVPDVGWPQQGLCVTIRTVPDKDGFDGGPSWEKDRYPGHRRGLGDPRRCDRRAVQR